MSFRDLGVRADIVAALDARGITEPFPVQAAAIPDALSGRDICAKAPTGSGKTIAFGIPIAARTSRSGPRRPHALVLAPTRELAQQIEAELTPIAEARDLRVLSVYGGVGYEKQKRTLKRGVDVLVACPGRLRDLVDQNALRLDRVEIAVIDEADRMADMGFLPEVCRILDMVPETRQTLLFSATLDGDVATLTERYQEDPAVHEVEGVSVDPNDLEHRFLEMKGVERPAHTADVVEAEGHSIIFTRTRHGADKVAKLLNGMGVASSALHGGMSQRQRERALAEFKQWRIRALVCTDVAARGIHVDDVACVIQYDPPEDAKTYIHRAGRTARAGATGIVVNYVLPDQRKTWRHLRRDLDIHAEPVPAGEATVRELREPRAERADDRRGPARPGGRPGRRTDAARRDRDDRAPRSRDDRPRRDREERPRRDDQDRPARSGDERPRRSRDDRPPRDRDERPTARRGERGERDREERRWDDRGPARTRDEHRDGRRGERVERHREDRPARDRDVRGTGHRDDRPVRAREDRPARDRDDRGADRRDERPVRDRDERGRARTGGAPKRAGRPVATKRKGKGKAADSTKDKGKPRWATKGSGRSGGSGGQGGRSA
ncbi:MAG: DEAD/DEAH box helicase [Actinomycetes bacterium]